MKTNYLVAGTLLIVSAALGAACNDNSGGSPGNPGAAGASAGTGGTGGTSAGGAGGAGGATPGFMSVSPCLSEGDYLTGTPTAGMPTINFGVNGALTYDPACLKTPAGSTVTFSGNFGVHPLVPSAMRGNTTNNPITLVPFNPDGGTMANASFTFPTAGFYAYYCAEHGSSDTGAGMAGVIWVQ
jgi:plastocyanin